MFKPRQALALSVFLISAFTAKGAWAAGPKELEVGVVGYDLKPAIGIPLAGYGDTLRRLKPIDIKNKYPHSFFFKPSEGVHTAIRSKVMLLKKDGRKLVFVSIDSIGVEFRFIDAIAKKVAKLGIRHEDLIVSGTHTHSGPGTLSRRLPLELVAVDLFIKKNFDAVVDGTVRSIELADQTAVPAELFNTSFIASGMQKNKFQRGAEWFNPEAQFLVARSKATREWMGGMVNFAVHGGGMPIELMLFSSDFPGQIEINIEKLLKQLNGPQSKQDVAILFMNGAEGDVAVPGRGVQLIEDLGAEFARQAAPAFTPARLKPVAPEFSVQQKKIWLGIPASPLKYCGEGILKKSPIPLRISLVPFMAQRAKISLVKVGEIAMMTWPGEASTTLGYELQGVAKSRGYKTSWVLGLTNDYMTYFTTKKEYHQGAYDSCSSLFNFRGAERIIKHYKSML
ncbi:MAG: neutral/alkaline non-lysosomal ceramidase N-terminal domain-containing protein [Bdellovibrionales bacterium]|nr:neutral/alkaline non-lysosomal ceramidase N-terminal domain-containing protein [Bdellovibrionales bacterium]